MPVFQHCFGLVLQCSIFVQFVSKDCTSKEEQLDTVPLKDRTRGIDLKEKLMTVVVKTNMQLSKLIAIATDRGRAPAMLGSEKGLVGLCKADDYFPKCWTFHCIIHKEHIVSKKLNSGSSKLQIWELQVYLPMILILKFILREPQGSSSSTYPRTTRLPPCLDLSRIQKDSQHSRENIITKKDATRHIVLLVRFYMDRLRPQREVEDPTLKPQTVGEGSTIHSTLKSSYHLRYCCPSKGGLRIHIKPTTRETPGS